MATRKNTPISNDDLLFALQERSAIYDQAWRAFETAQEAAPRGSIAFDRLYRQSCNLVKFHEILNEAILCIRASTVTGALIQFRAIEYLQAGDPSERNSMIVRAGFESVGMALEAMLSLEDRKRLGFKADADWLMTNYTTDVDLYRRGMEIIEGPEVYEGLTMSEEAA